MAGNNALPPLVYRGALEIGRAVGINAREIAFYVREKGLPAFKIERSKEWVAKPEDLVAWIDRQRETQLGQLVKKK